MYRFNQVCSPEMSFLTSEDSVDSSPHVYVQFDSDEAKSAVPLSFVLSHPVNWREKASWDSSYLYKVFWSPAEDDSPAIMLQREACIPTFEKGTSLEKPGYYRAAVLAVGESLQDLLDKWGSKRVSVGLLKFKHTSFDGPGEQVKPKPAAKQGTHSTLSKDPNIKKRKKTNVERKEAHRKNLDFDSQLGSVYPFLNSKPTEGDAEQQQDSSLGVRRSSRKPKDTSINLKEDSSESEVEFDDGSKKMKLDLAYTPKKTVELEEQLQQSSNNLANAYKRNAKLEADKNALQVELDSKILELNQLKQQYENEIKMLKKELNVKTTEMLEMKEQLEHLQNKNKDILNFPQSIKPDPDSMQQSFPGLNDSEDLFDGTDTGIVEKCDPLKYVKVEMKEESEDKDNCGSDIPDKMEVKTAVKMEPQGNQEPDVKAETENTNGDHELCPGVFIKRTVWTAIQAIPTKAKKDKMFIKDLVLAAFGPEVVASSTIKGTKKGGRKKKKQDGEEDEKEHVQPKLDPTILKAVRDEFIKRVETDEKKKIDASTHERTQEKSFHDAIRDGKKRLKELGYGTGKKSNTVDVSLLMG